MPVESYYKQSPEMDEEQFHLWQALLEDRTGMQLSTQRKRFLETSLSMRMREIGCVDYHQYYEQLVNGPNGNMEWACLVDRLTVQETRFFRHPSSFDLLRTFFREEIEQRDARSFDIWSVGCSTGEEPYSLAMVAEEECTQPGLPKMYYGITGTDISLPALNKARQGIYRESKLAALEEERRERFFDDIGPGKYQIKASLRDRVCFACINVLDLGVAPLKDLDVIFCQNLLIYFRRWRKRQIINTLAQRLRPGGLMVLGVGEVVDNLHPSLKRVTYENTLAFKREDVE